MSSYALLWLALGLLATLAELHARTLYLLALAAALFAGAAAAFLGASAAPQFAAIGMVCLAGFPAAAWYRTRLARRSPLASADLGHEVRVLAVNADRLRVAYRGTEWDAVCADSSAAAIAPGDRLRIAATRGSLLELTHF